MSNNNLSLFQLLKDKELTPQKLFNSKNIVSEIKNNIQNFVKYSLRHKKFIYQCLDILFNSSYEQLQLNDCQNIAFGISQVLCCDEPVISDLFFQPSPESINNTSQISQNIVEQQGDNIQSEAQRLFQSDQVEQNIEQAINLPLQIKKDELAQKSLQILTNQNKNQSSLGYLYKIWVFLIRNDANKVLQFFHNNRQYYQRLIQNLEYHSVSNLLAQLIVSQDKTKLYKYQNFKKQIFYTVIDKLLKQKQNQLLFEGITIFLQQVLNNSKQSYYEYFQDFKRIVNYISSFEVLKQFYEILIQKNQKSFKNALIYLQLVFQRINSQKQQNGMQRQHQQDQPPMIFQVDIFYTNFSILVQIIDSIENFTNITKITYLTFLNQIIQTAKFGQNLQKINLPKTFAVLINSIKKQSSKGIYKVKLSKVLQEIIKRCNQEEISNFIQLNPEFYQNYFTTIKGLNFENNKLYNKNQNVAFQCKILFQIDKKVQNTVNQASKIHNKNLKRIQKKFQTKIANFGRSKSISLEEQGFINFNQSFDFNRESKNQSSNQSNFVGKNNVSIPVLNLPENLRINKDNPQRKVENSARRSQNSERTSQQNKESSKLNEKKQQIQQQEIQKIQLNSSPVIIKIPSKEQIVSTNEFKQQPQTPIIKLNQQNFLQHTKNVQKNKEQNSQKQKKGDKKQNTKKEQNSETKNQTKKQINLQKQRFFLKHEILIF